MWEEPEPADTSWHGTHIAGLIAGAPPDGGLLGAAPEAILYCGSVIEAGAILARILLGLDWLAGCRISVANLAFGFPGRAPVFRTMLRVLAEQDILITAPIGNRGAGNAFIPGSDPHVLSVGAADEAGQVAKFSGSLNDPITKSCRKPDLVAPGLDVRSCVPGGGYEVHSGTSMATARVAGIVALLRGAHPGAPAAAVAHALRSTSLAVPPEQAHRARYGLVRGWEAFQALATMSEEPPAPAAQEPFANYVDRRLADRLSYTGDTDDQEAILEFADFAERRDFVDRLGRLPAPNGHTPHVSVLCHAPICIVRLPARLLKDALNQRSMRVASACDVDRSRYFK